MGIGAVPQQILRELAIGLPKNFSVLEFGDQLVATDRRRADKPTRWVRVPSEPFYRKLGCGSYTSMDANGKATVLVDLNYPFLWTETYDLVTDWGTSEHIFDIAQCWKTKHYLTKVGGFSAGEQPYIGYRKHSFYSLHPELIQDIAAANDYRIEFLDTPEMERGTLVRYVLQRTKAGEFKVPTQGKYKARLKI